MRALLPWARATDSLAAASGRHRMAMSASCRHARRASGSFRLSSGRVSMLTSGRSASLSNIRSPVVPSLPSINTLTLMENLLDSCAQYA